MQNTFMNIAQLMKEVNRLFASPNLSSEDLRVKLVPTGTSNTATPGSFGPAGIYKYEYNLISGESIIVKCHIQHSSALGGPTCNSYRFPTAQIYVGRRGHITHHVVWDTLRNRAVLIRKASWKCSDQLKNWSHIPVQWNSFPIPGSPSIWRNCFLSFGNQFFSFYYS